MDWTGIAQGIVTAVALGIIFGIAKLFQRIYALETKVEPVISWYVKTSMDAMKFATNPTSERLAALADKYIACVIGSGEITPEEKQELIDGLLDIYHDRKQMAGKRQSASVSLRFIEAQEGLQLLPLERAVKTGVDQ